MNISILCETVEATQVISFLFDQSSIKESEQIKFSLHQWSELKTLSRIEAYAEIFNCNYLILSRWYDFNSFKGILDEAKRLNKNVFLHLDDYLYDVPKSIGKGKWEHYHNKDRMKALHDVTKSVKGLIVSTSRLCSEIQKILPNISIYTCPFYKVFEAPQLNDNDYIKSPYPTIGYMGTKSHIKDLDIIVPKIEKLMNNHRNLKFESFGLQPPKTLVKKFPDRCTAITRVSNYQEFKTVLKSRGWWVGLAPLIENNFNYCKANTKLLEHIQAKIPIIASKFGPYEDIPCLSPIHSNIKEESWMENISRVLYSRSLRSKLYQAQLDYCKQYSNPFHLVEFYKKLNTV
ncbi:hypothetical protein [Synechococcus sp. CC9605]|uniref:hypothetical protein n=1 Tax=Synechococcus sp. (strain CC9605) TaxID=110662 RepID=UPI00005D55F5|nr:hypothetical protein [Synechococcus sp. CC9605]ABB33921.1 hypothetical protein Syncc9605_0145 [Synechococcus sp. CC9605]